MSVIHKVICLLNILAHLMMFSAVSDSEVPCLTPLNTFYHVFTVTIHSADFPPQYMLQVVFLLGCSVLFLGSR